jgi:FkbM family methyltransferase
MPFRRRIRRALHHSSLGKELLFRWSLSQARGWTEVDDRRLRFYSQFIAAGDICFDIGAHYGNRSKVFRRLGAHTVAVDPQQSCIRALRSMFARDSGITLLQNAVGATELDADIYLCDETCLSSLSKSWISSVTESGRFRDAEWVSTERVPVITLDSLIQTYGVPSFVKIDVEGYEYETIRGLGRPLKCMSIEFAPEAMENTRGILARLQTLGFQRYNFSLGESMELQFPEWISAEQLLDYLRAYHGNTVMYGDTYAAA